MLVGHIDGSCIVKFKMLVKSSIGHLKFFQPIFGAQIVKVKHILGSVFAFSRKVLVLIHSGVDGHGVGAASTLIRIQQYWIINCTFHGLIEGASRSAFHITQV